MVQMGPNGFNFCSDAPKNIQKTAHDAFASQAALTGSVYECYNLLAANGGWQRDTEVHRLLSMLRKQVMRMSDFEIISIFLAVIGLLISAYKLGKK